jgi:hypothetical protein
MDVLNLAAADHHIFTVEGIGTPRLLELDADKGAQVPLADVQFSSFIDPYAVTTGP